MVTLGFGSVLCCVYKCWYMARAAKSLIRICQVLRLLSGSMQKNYQVICLTQEPVHFVQSGYSPQYGCSEQLSSDFKHLESSAHWLLCFRLLTPPHWWHSLFNFPFSRIRMWMEVLAKKLEIIINTSYT